MSEFEDNSSFGELGIHIPEDKKTDVLFEKESVERADAVVSAAEAVNASMTDAQRMAIQEAGEIYKDIEKNPKDKNARIKRAGKLIYSSYTPIQLEPRPEAVGIPSRMDTVAQAKRSYEKDTPVTFSGIIQNVAINRTGKFPRVTLQVTELPPQDQSAGSTLPMTHEVVASQKLAVTIAGNKRRFDVNTTVSLNGVSRRRPPSEQFPQGQRYILATRLAPIK